MTRFAFGTVEWPNGTVGPAIHASDQVAPLNASSDDLLPRARTIMDLMEDWHGAVAAAGRLAEAVAAGRCPRAVPVADVRPLAPLQPRQAFCTGANYHRHVVEIICDRFSDQKIREGLAPAQVRVWAEEMMAKRAAEGQPYIFSRVASSYAGPYDDLELPDFATEPDWEAELAVVFASEGRNVAREDAMSIVAGYMVVNDVTNRDQIFTADPADLGSDWLHAKNNPGYFPMGPWLVPAMFVKDPHDLRITLLLNGKTMQDEKTDDMIFDIPRQIEVLTKYARILPGDVLATGSPAGNGTHYGRYLKPGDEMQVSVEGLGTQVTRCVAAGERTGSAGRSGSAAGEGREASL